MQAARIIVEKKQKPVDKGPYTSRSTSGNWISILYTRLIHLLPFCLSLMLMNFYLNKDNYVWLNRLRNSCSFVCMMYNRIN